MEAGVLTHWGFRGRWRMLLSLKVGLLGCRVLRSEFGRGGGECGRLGVDLAELGVG